MTSALTTAFASPERVAPEDILAEYRTFIGSHCRAFFDTLPTMIMALNGCRQVVFANQATVDFLGKDSVEEVLGKRPGEAFGCINAEVGPGGCGTSKHCRSCEAIRAILTALGGDRGQGDCKLLRREHSMIEGLDLKVSASPLYLDERSYVIYAITDVSHEMRRRSMERIFFHDVLNLAGGINGLVELLREDAAANGPSDELFVLSSATQTLVDEIIAQRELLAAEAKELKPTYAHVGSRSLLDMLQRLYATSPPAQGQELRLGPGCADVLLETDMRLAQRVLGNMIKNAFEAGAPGDAVTLACVDEGESVRFTVHNPAYIQPGIQESIFHRRFSTKGAGRGLGAYSMMLLSERYLQGAVGFSSDEASGTTFFLLLPKQLGKE